MTSCSAMKCRPTIVAPCAAAKRCFFRFSWSARHSLVETNPTNRSGPSRSATHRGTGSGYSLCSSGIGVWSSTTRAASPSALRGFSSHAIAAPPTREAHWRAIHAFNG